MIVSRRNVFVLLVLVIILCLPYLSAVQTDRYREVLRHGRGQPLDIEWHPNGTHLLVITQNEAWLYTADNFTTLAHIDKVNWASFSPDGQWLILRDLQNVYRLHDAERLTQPPVLDGLEYPRFTSDGRYVLTQPTGGAVVLRRSDALHQTISLPDALRTPEIRLVLRPEGAVLTGFTPDGKLIVWEIESATPPETIPLSKTLPVENFSWSPDGRKLLGYADNLNMFVLDGATGKTLVSIPHTQNGNVEYPSLYWSPGSQHFVRRFYSTLGHGFELYNVEDGQLITQQQSDELTPPYFSPDGRYASTSLGIYRSDTFERIAESYGFDQSWSADSRFVVIGCSMVSGFSVFDAQSGNLIIQLNNDPVKAGSSRTRWSPDGSRLVNWESDGRILLWDTITWEQIAAFDAHVDMTRKVAFSPDSQLLGAADAVGTIRIWDTQTYTLRHTIQTHTSALSAMEWQPNGSLFFTRTGQIPVSWIETPDSHFVYFWDGQTGERVTTFEHAAVVTDTAWSPNGQYLASASTQDLKIWDVQKRMLIFDQPVSSYPYGLVAWSPDSSIVSLSDGRISHGGKHFILWDVETGQTVARSISAHGTPLWTPDSGHMIMVSAGCPTTASSPNCSIGVRILFDRANPTPDRSIDLSASLSGLRFGIFSTHPHIVISPAGGVLAALEQNRVEVWQFDHEQAEFVREIEGVERVNWSPDGRYLAVTYIGNQVDLLDGQTGEIVLRVKNATNPFWRADQNGLRFFTYQPAPEGLPRLQKEWDLTTRLRVDIGEYLNQTWSPDGRLWADPRGGVLRLWAD